MISKLYGGLLVIATLLAMALLGMLILVLIAEVTQLVAPTYRAGMGR
jgi:hypothetical protein